MKKSLLALLAFVAALTSAGASASLQSDAMYQSQLSSNPGGVVYGYCGITQPAATQSSLVVLGSWISSSISEVGQSLRQAEQQTATTVEKSTEFTAQQNRDNMVDQNAASARIKAQETYGALGQSDRACAETVAAADKQVAAAAKSTVKRNMRENVQAYNAQFKHGRDLTAYHATLKTGDFDPGLLSPVKGTLTPQEAGKLREAIKVSLNPAPAHVLSADARATAGGQRYEAIRAARDFRIGFAQNVIADEIPELIGTVSRDVADGLSPETGDGDGAAPGENRISGYAFLTREVDSFYQNPEYETERASKNEYAQLRYLNRQLALTNKLLLAQLRHVRQSSINLAFMQATDTTTMFDPSLNSAREEAMGARSR